MSDVEWFLTWGALVIMFCVSVDTLVASAKGLYKLLVARRHRTLRSRFKAMPYRQKIKQYNLEKLKPEGLALWLSAVDLPTPERQRITNVVNLIKGGKFNA